MITEEHLAKIIKAQANQKIVYKKQLSDSDDILRSFVEILNNKPDNYWLIRESREIGMISISFKKNRKVEHLRFAFIRGKWSVIPGSMLSVEILNELQYEKLHQYNIADKCEELINLCQSRGLDKNKLVLPNPHQQSNWSDYNNYIVSAENEKRFADPIEALKKIYTTIDNAIANVDLLTTLHNAAFMQTPDTLSDEALKNVFSAWLMVNDFDHDVQCPISYELFKMPYVLSSGRVFEKSSLFNEEGGLKFTDCPITNRPIVSHPYRLEGYTSLLQSCLEKFVELINLCKPQQERPAMQAASIINPSHVPASLFYNDSSQSGAPKIASDTLTNRF